MKKSIAIIASVVLVLVLAAILFGCVPSNYDKAAEKLNKAGYDVVAMSTKADGSFIGNIANAVANAAYNGMQSGLSATKGSESVTIMWFDTYEHAKDAYNRIKENDSSVVRNGKIVYYGTEQGKKDASR